jgi:hypothetical protein
VPPKVREPLIAWLKHLLAGVHGVLNGRTRHLELLSEVRMGVPEETYIRWSDYTKVLREHDGPSLLAVIDAALAAGWYGTGNKELDETLKLAKSKWMGGERFGKPGLVSREPEGMQDMVGGDHRELRHCWPDPGAGMGQGPRLHARRPRRRRGAGGRDGCPQAGGTG